MIKKVNYSRWLIDYYIENVLFINFFRVTPMAYVSSQAKSWIRAAASVFCRSNIQIQTTSATYTTAQDNAGSLTHWARPGIETVSSWILDEFVTVEPL